MTDAKEIVGTTMVLVDVTEDLAKEHPEEGSVQDTSTRTYPYNALGAAPIAFVAADRHSCLPSRYSGWCQAIGSSSFGHSWPVAFGKNVRAGHGWAPAESRSAERETVALVHVHRRNRRPDPLQSETDRDCRTCTHLHVDHHTFLYTPTYLVCNNVCRAISLGWAGTQVHEPKKIVFWEVDGFRLCKRFFMLF